MWEKLAETILQERMKTRRQLVEDFFEMFPQETVEPNIRVRSMKKGEHDWSTFYQWVIQYSTPIIFGSLKLYPCRYRLGRPHEADVVLQPIFALTNYFNELHLVDNTRYAGMHVYNSYVSF